MKNLLLSFLVFALSLNIGWSQCSPIATQLVATSNSSIQATVFGGDPPIQYYWSNGDTSSFIENLAPGAYYCIASPANLACADTVSITLPTPDPQGVLWTSFETPQNASSFYISKITDYKNNELEKRTKIITAEFIVNLSDGNTTKKMNGTTTFSVGIPK